MPYAEVTVAGGFIHLNAFFVGLYRFFEPFQLLEYPSFLKACSSKGWVDEQAVVHGPKGVIMILHSCI